MQDSVFSFATLSGFGADKPVANKRLGFDFEFISCMPILL
jgi:hypothetical protein